MKSFIKIHPRDNVIVALKELKKGVIIELDKKNIEIIDNIGRGHKIAIENIKEGQSIIKYGYPIGRAAQTIKIGEHVHTHNVKTTLSNTLTYTFNQSLNTLPYKDRHLTFKGYKRPNGSAGIRNELWIIPTVGCVNGVAERIKKQFLKDFKELAVDTVEVFKHNYGCSQLGEDHENTRAILANMVTHPNNGGALVLGLGCENNSIESFKKKLKDYNRDRVMFIEAQAVEDEIQEGVDALKKLYLQMHLDKRVDIPLSELKIGLKCGGSDGLSGLTANPLVGMFSDFLISQGGTTVLTEVPEMFGAETILMNRAKDYEVFNKIVKLINDFKEYFISHNQTIYENPSPGNKEGGITTLEDKSLGCTQKGGKATVTEVLDYGETIKEKGLHLLNSPGNDLVAATALASTGCQIVLFTTGRGTPFGTFVPTMKISTNTPLYKQKSNWIDFNAGTLVESQSKEEVLEYFIKDIVAVASGKRVKNEINDYREIAIFKSGVTL